MEQKNGYNQGGYNPGGYNMGGYPSGPQMNMNSGDDYTPISMWGYFGWSILFGLPVIGWILAIVMSFAPKNVNIRNFARSRFCLLIIMVILFVILSLLGVGIGNAVYSSF